MRITRDLLAGLLLGGFGIGAMVVARGYGIGTAQRMGPGFFPMLLGAVVAFIGTIIVVRALLDRETAEPVGSWSVRPLVLIVAAVLAFAALVDSWGLVAGLAALLVIGCWAGGESSPMETAFIVLVLTVLAVAIFVYGLGFPFRLVP